MGSPSPNATARPNASKAARPPVAKARKSAKRRVVMQIQDLRLHQLHISSGLSMLSRGVLVDLPRFGYKEGQVRASPFQIRVMDDLLERGLLLEKEGLVRTTPEGKAVLLRALEAEEVPESFDGTPGEETKGSGGVEEA